MPEAEPSPRIIADRAFGVGCAKSATHALAAFGGARAAHEPDAQAMLRLTLNHAAGRIEPDTFATLIGQLIERRDLALHVSQINGFIIDTLFGLYPTARYVLTIRDARSWMRSFVNHQLTIGNAPGSAWPAFQRLRFAPQPVAHVAEDASLGAHGLYPVDAYLGYWMRHNAKVIATVPPARLLIVPTAALDTSQAEVAAFLDRPDLLDVPAMPRVFEGRYVPSPLDVLDQDWLTSRIAFHTAALFAAAGDRLPPAISAALTPQ